LRASHNRALAQQSTGWLREATEYTLNGTYEDEVVSTIARADKKVPEAILNGR
jgi:hypothetical protein